MEGKIKENVILLKVILNFEEDQVFLDFIQKLQSRVQVLKPNPTRIESSRYSGPSVNLAHAAATQLRLSSTLACLETSQASAFVDSVFETRHSFEALTWTSHCRGIFNDAD